MTYGITATAITLPADLSADVSFAQVSSKAAAAFACGPLIVSPS